MNIEEAIENLKKYISFSKKECNFPSIWEWNWHMDLANDVETLLTAYEKEKETSHYIQSQLDIANANLIEEKEKNKKDIKFKRILADNLKKHIDRIIIGKSTTFPCGWVYKKDLLNLIEDIKWTN